ncbi:MAG: hypothetical protein F6K41_14440 [Symploca sp. SIO3E6]|nr:hypothetical protein [Caldora sp. SIO3E6]
MGSVGGVGGRKTEGEGFELIRVVLGAESNRSIFFELEVFAQLMHSILSLPRQYDLQ